MHVAGGKAVEERKPGTRPPEKQIESFTIGASGMVDELGPAITVARDRKRNYACWAMAVDVAREGYELWRPNREKSETKTTKFLVSFVLLVSAGLLIVITIGGWSRLEGASVGIATLIWAGLYIVFAFLVGARWQRGVLPVASALAIILAIFAAVAAPAWFDRNKPVASTTSEPGRRHSN